MSRFDPLKRVQRLRRADQRREHGPGQDRLPPGQVLTPKFPVLHYGNTPHIDPKDWRLKVWGLVEEPRELTWEEFMGLPRQRQVTGHKTRQMRRRGFSFDSREFSGSVVVCKIIF